MVHHPLQQRAAQQFPGHLRPIASRQHPFAKKTYGDPGDLIALTALTGGEHLKMSAFAVSCVET
jgi:hypothetical protein